MNIYSAASIEQSQGTYLIYGTPGMGKTTSLKFLPGETLVLDVDRTTRVLRGCNHIDIVEIDNIDTFKAWTNILEELLKTCKGIYDNVAVDNITELERCILSALGREGKNKGVPSQGDYQYMQFKLVNSLRYLKNIDSNVILTAWETSDLYTDSGGTQYNRSFPQINGKIVNNICGLCDVVGRIAVNSEGERGFWLSATNSIYAKNQLDQRKGCKIAELIPCNGDGEDEQTAQLSD